MPTIVFIDTEIDPKTKKVLDIGSVKSDGSSFHSGSQAEFIQFLRGAEYLCGHNILNHDLKYIQSAIESAGIDQAKAIDTLHLSPLLFPAKPYHALLKDDKLQTDDLNNPLNDALKAKDLFLDEVRAFHQADPDLKQIYYQLLKGTKEFGAFFCILGVKGDDIPQSTNHETIDNLHLAVCLEMMIRDRFQAQICERADISKMIGESPLELAYCLALIHTGSRYSITPPWVLKNYPQVERVMFLLRNSPCLTGCAYCDQALDIRRGLKQYFGYDAYRTYAGEPLQEKAVQAAVDNKSLLAIFPTGGGKSITFQVPALMSGVNAKGLTVVISPLQSLMKDQVDNLEKLNITDAVTINGLLDPIERAKSLERVENGSVSILYISPESLRSKTIERLLLGRNVVRFVIDEAHCFSAWGQDFRVDYLYIGDFIKTLQEKKNLAEGIPVSCFTATAKQKVMEDIRSYFREKLSLELEVYRAESSRTNLHYQVFAKESEDEKYYTVRNLLAEKDCPTIIYVSRTRKAYLLAERLTKDGYPARAYHGQMDKQEKTENQDAFMNGEVRIMVATSAFGMGVDKKDVGLVIHFDISDSLENYVQEAGRAGRDENISAECFVLFNDEDLNKHFTMLNQTKLSMQEIQQVWKAVKDVTRMRSRVSQSTLEIARKAGWDDTVRGIETRVTTAIAALENAGYLKRGQNSPHLFANGILVKNTEEAVTKINNSLRFDEKEKEQAIRIIKKLIGSHSRINTDKNTVDEIADHLGLKKEEVIHNVNLLREENILADSKDLQAFIRKKENVKNALSILNIYYELEKFLLIVITDEEKIIQLKELNELAEEYGCKDVTPQKIRTVLNLWTIKNWIKRQTSAYSKNHLAVMALFAQDELAAKLEKRHEIAHFILDYLYSLVQKETAENDIQPDGQSTKQEAKPEEISVEFSVLELKEQFAGRDSLFPTSTEIEEIEDALFYLSRIEALKIEGGFMVLYNALRIERLELDNKKRYKLEDYQKLNQYYQSKIQQIHIVGEYARKMIQDYKAALQFVEDYFKLQYASFLHKYFPGSRQEQIKKNITPAKFKQLFGELSPTQLKIINDKESKTIVVAAGPGSGKTRILVHKLASLLLMEDIKQEQLLMLTFSRSAATEFKKRLLELIKTPAHYVEIKTFHSYCFDLLGRVGTIEKSDGIIQETVCRIKNGEVERARITKAVLVIDEAQDMDADEYALIRALMEQNEEMRVIAVGDDDQNIYEFRGSSSEYFKDLMTRQNAQMYELVQNYRSKSNLVDYSNQFLSRLPNRLKQTSIIAVDRSNGILKVVRYRSRHLIQPLIRDILTEGLTGSTCVLTRTNDEALQITGLLVKNGLHAKQIQSNEGFNLSNLLEVRSFLDGLKLVEDIAMISDENWDQAKRKLADRFARSKNYEICSNLIRDFEAINPKYKYKSDLEVFIRESKLEDFLGENSETIFVSTIHKAKGREYDHVFLMLDGFDPKRDEAKRQLYVAMTRAKQNLTIHYNGNYLDFIKTEGLQIESDDRSYSPPNELTIQLTYRDVWLDFFESRQYLIDQLKSGDVLAFNQDGCGNAKGLPVIKFSKQFSRRMKELCERGYAPQTANVRFIVCWQKEDAENEIRIVLPEVYFGF